MSRSNLIIKKDLREKIVELSYIYPSAAELARILNIRPELLYRWRAQSPSMGKFNSTMETDRDLSEMVYMIDRLKEEIQNHKKEQEMLEVSINKLTESFVKKNRRNFSSKVLRLLKFFDPQKH